MLDLRDLGLEDIEELGQVDLIWKLIPLNYCSGKEGKACINLICSQLAIMVFSSSSTSLLILVFINGNKVVAYFV